MENKIDYRNIKCVITVYNIFIGFGIGVHVLTKSSIGANSFHILSKFIMQDKKIDTIFPFNFS